MAKSGITNITTSQSFQNWFDKTNEMVDLFRDEVITATTGGDVTTGNATLVGQFTANTVTAFNTLATDTFTSRSGSGIDVNDRLDILPTSSKTAAEFVYTASGPQINFTDDSLTWNVGIEDVTDHKFFINTGVGAAKLTIATDGTVDVPNTLTAANISSANVTISAGGTLSGANTDMITEGAGNLYYTDARAQAAFGASTGVIFTDNSGVTDISIGQDVATTADVTFGGVKAKSFGYWQGPGGVNGPVEDEGLIHEANGVRWRFIGGNGYLALQLRENNAWVTKFRFNTNGSFDAVDDIEAFKDPIE